MGALQILIDVKLIIKYVQIVKMQKRHLLTIKYINGMKIKIYHFTDPDFRRLCGIELTDNEFTEVKVDNNGQVTNTLKEEEKK